MLDNVRRITRQLAAYGTADIAVMVVNFLLLPIYTRVLSTREYGALALLLVCEAFLKVVFRWGLDHAYLRTYYDYPTDAERKTLATTLALFMLVVNGAITAALFALTAPINHLLFDSSEWARAYQILLANSFLASFLFLPLTLLRIQERARYFATLSFLRSFGTVIMRLILVVGLRYGILGITLADVIVTVALYAGMARVIRATFTWRVDWSMLRASLAYGSPQVPFGILTQSMAMGDRFLLAMFMPLSDVGIYLIGVTMASVIKMYPVAFEAAWMPFAFDSMSRPDAPKLYARLGTYAYTVLVVLTLSLSALVGPLTRLLLPPQYQAAAGLVPLLAAGAAVQTLSWFLYTSLNIAKQTKHYPSITVIGALAMAGCAVLLIPRFGMTGAALAVVLSQVLTTAGARWFAQRAYPIPYETRRLVTATLVGLATFAAASAVPSAGLASLLARGALLALFPLGLLVLRFFEPHEIHAIRHLVLQLALRGSSRAGELARHTDR